jgi:hypothetical protein
MKLKPSFISYAAAAFAAAICSSTVLAAPQWCTGTVAQLWVDADGNVMAYTSWRADHIRMCNLNNSVSTSNGIAVTPTTCMSWLSLLRTAVQNQKSTITYYVEAPSCSSIATYGNAPVPYYVMLQQ